MKTRSLGWAESTAAPSRGGPAAVKSSVNVLSSRLLKRSGCSLFLFLKLRTAAACAVRRSASRVFISVWGTQQQDAFRSVEESGRAVLLTQNQHRRRRRLGQCRVRQRQRLQGGGRGMAGPTLTTSLGPGAHRLYYGLVTSLKDISFCKTPRRHVQEAFYRMKKLARMCTSDVLNMRCACFWTRNRCAFQIVCLTTRQGLKLPGKLCK